MTITVQRINDETIKKVKLQNEELSKPIKGYALFPEIYSNIFICSKKKSGKTTVLFNIVKKCCSKKTKVILFCSTHNKDSTYKAIKKYMDNNDIDYAAYTSLQEDGVDKLEELIQELQQETEDGEDVPNDRSKNIIMLDESSEEEEIERPSKYRVPEYLIILDDLSTELKSKSLVSLLKKNRHFKSKIIISSQYWNDLLPESRKQLDYILIFRSMPENKLKEIYRDADLAIDYETFERIYRHSTQNPFSFLYIDCINGEFRQNFSHRYNLPK